jgi:CHRD domain
VAVAFSGAMTSPMEGQITLDPAQAADLLAGKWYVDIHTLAFPAGEIRGQMTLRE